MLIRGCVFTVLLLAAAGFAASGGSGRAEYVGGTLAELAQGAGRIDLTDNQFFRFRARTAALRIPYENINLLEYGQNVSRRYIMAIAISPLLVLSKKRKHYLTVGYADDLGRQQALVFEVDKNSVRSVLAGLEARTGRKVQPQDIETRKGGK